MKGSRAKNHQLFSFYFIRELIGCQKQFLADSKTFFSLVDKIFIARFKLETAWCFFKGCHHPGGPWAHVTSFTCKAMYSHPIKITLELILCLQTQEEEDFFTEISQWKVLAGAEFQTCRDLRLGICHQHFKFPAGLPWMYHPGPMLIDLSVQMGIGVSYQRVAGKSPEQLDYKDWFWVKYWNKALNRHVHRWLSTFGLRWS